MKLSFILPVLNEAEHIRRILLHLAEYRRHGHEVIVVDGGSRDGTLELAHTMADQLIESTKGRARQMNAGAAQASGEVLVFLHADTWLPEYAAKHIVENLKRSGRVWGRFDVSLTGSKFIFRLISMIMNLRSRLTGIATGDQCLFVTRTAFETVNGYPDIPLMEDIAVSKRLKRISAPICLRDRVTTSSRRWEQQGIVRTILLMWYLRARYFLGSSPDKLVKIYYQNV